MLNPLRRRKDHEVPKRIGTTWWKRLASLCFAHLIPVLASITLIGLNASAFYLGAKYRGGDDEETQNMIRLILQVTAKLLEVLIAASLAVTIRDFMYYLLTKDNNGLPLGTMTVDVMFSQIIYIFSSQFRAGVWSIPTKSLRFFFIIWVLASALLVTFAGPATATLMLARDQGNWPAGGANFHVVGSPDALSPTHLSSESWGDMECSSPLTSDVLLPSEHLYGCPWAGYTTLLSSYAQWGSQLNIYLDNPIVFYELAQTRQVVQRSRAIGQTPESWALATRVPANVWGGSIHLGWRGAIYNDKHGPNNNNFARSAGWTTHIAAKLPAVRTVCYNQTVTIDTKSLIFPLLQPFETWSEASLFVLPESFLVQDSRNHSDQFVEWIPVPPTGLSATDKTPVNVFASALFRVQVPEGPNGIPASTVTCTIDARWAPGDIASYSASAAITPNLDPGHLRAPATSDYTGGYNGAAGFLPREDGSWEQITMDQTWLEALTPAIQWDGNNRTTASILFEAVGLVNGSNDLADDTSRHYELAGGALAALVADGISRIGIQYQLDDIPYKTAGKIDKNDYDQFFRGDGRKPLETLLTFPTPPGVDEANSTLMTWFVTVPGLAYTADTTSIYLSIAVLAIYCGMAAFHFFACLLPYNPFGIPYIVHAWESAAVDFIALAKTSPYNNNIPGTLSNTCAGVGSRETWGKGCRVLRRKDPRPGEEQLYLAIGQDDDEWATREGGGGRRRRRRRGDGRTDGDDDDDDDETDDSSLNDGADRDKGRVNFEDEYGEVVEEVPPRD